MSRGCSRCRSTSGGLGQLLQLTFLPAPPERATPRRRYIALPHGQSLGVGVVTRVAFASGADHRTGQLGPVKTARVPAGVRHVPWRDPAPPSAQRSPRIHSRHRLDLHLPDTLRRRAKRTAVRRLAGTRARFVTVRRNPQVQLRAPTCPGDPAWSAGVRHQGGIRALRSSRRGRDHRGVPRSLTHAPNVATMTQSRRFARRIQRRRWAWMRGKPKGRKATAAAARATKAPHDQPNPAGLSRKPSTTRATLTPVMRVRS